VLRDQELLIRKEAQLGRHGRDPGASR